MAANSSPGPQDSSEISTTSIDWGKIDTAQDARAILEQTYGSVLDSSRLFGDGAEFIKDKDRLVGVPFIICDWKFIVDGDSGNTYVNVLIMSPQGEKARFNDGSTGVYAQLREISEQFGVVGIQVKNGLRKSEYDKEVDGKVTRAKTYYISA